MNDPKPERPMGISLAPTTSRLEPVAHNFKVVLCHEC